jgi:hypothetical protein
MVAREPAARVAAAARVMATAGSCSCQRAGLDPQIGSSEVITLASASRDAR